MKTRIALLAFGMACSPGTALRAQIAAGRVVTASNMLPRAGVTILLVDAEERVVAKTHSDSVEGSFSVKAPTPGTFRMAMYDESGGAFLTSYFDLRAVDSTRATYTLPEVATSFPGVRRASDVTIPARLIPGRSGFRPPDQVRSGRRGYSTVMFVVDSAGHPDVANMLAIVATSPNFAATTRDGLARIDFEPARVDDKPVSQVVLLTVSYGLAGDKLIGDATVISSPGGRVRR